MNCRKVFRYLYSPLTTRTCRTRHGRTISTLFILAAAALCAPPKVQAQCYAFTAGTSASLILNVTNVGTPTTEPDGDGGTIYNYSLTSLSGNTATATLGTTTYNITPFYAWGILIDSGNPYFTEFGTAPSTNSYGGFSATLSFLASGEDLMPNGWPAAAFPPVALWNTSGSQAQLTLHLGSANYGPYNVTSITPCTPQDIAKTLGDCETCAAAAAGAAAGGEPITLATGNLFETAEDYTTAGPNPLYFRRYYNSANAANGSLAGSMGPNWRTPFDRYLQITPATSPTTVIAERADGKQLTFTLSGGAWVTDSDVDYTLANSGTTWTLTGPDDTVESYTDNGASEGILNSITLRDGYTQTLTYTSGQLTSVTDSYGRSLIRLCLYRLFPDHRDDAGQHDRHHLRLQQPGRVDDGDLPHQPVNDADLSLRKQHLALCADRHHG
jgi:hypothetical protein